MAIHPDSLKPMCPMRPHAQQLQVDASCSSDGGLILLTESAAAHP